MRITMNGTLMGTKKTDYETWQHVNIYLLVKVKGGEGQMTNKYKFMDGFQDYDRYKKMIGSTVQCEGDMEVNDKQEQTISIVSMSSIAGSVKKMATA